MREYFWSWRFTWGVFKPPFEGVSEAPLGQWFQPPVLARLSLPLLNHHGLPLRQHGYDYRFRASYAVAPKSATSWLYDEPRTRKATPSRLVVGHGQSNARLSRAVAGLWLDMAGLVPASRGLWVAMAMAGRMPAFGGPWLARGWPQLAHLGRAKP